MIETLASAARVLQAGVGGLLLGRLVFDALVRGSIGDPIARRGVRALLLALGTMFVLAGVLSLAAQTALITGRDAALQQPEEWLHVARDTLSGNVWLWRQGCMLAAVFVGLAAGATPWVRQLALPILVALACALGAGSGHATALEPAWPGLLAHALHIAAYGAWWGGLLCLAIALGSVRDQREITPLFRRFSALATVAMLVVLPTGLYLAYNHVGTWPPLFGTRYGQFLLLKLALVTLVLLLAAHLRWHWLARLPHLGQQLLLRYAPRWVWAEFLLAAMVIVIGVLLSETPPARHEQVVWPFAFRFAPQLTWGKAEVMWQMILPTVIAALGAGSLLLARRRGRKPLFTCLGTLAIATALALAIAPLCVPAYRDTYRSSAVPYHAISISNGAALFQEHCTACHGKGGLGNGPRAATLARPPADLSAPHTGDHTAGDMFSWLSQGMPSGAMPGFAATLDEEARWDLINYLRTFASGYQARVIQPRIAPLQPWLGAPDYNYVTQSGASGSLKELRGVRPALLVFYTLPQSAPRLRQLESAALPDVRVLAIPMRGETQPGAHTTLPTVQQGGEEIVETYQLLRRTLRNPDAGDTGAMPTHMEILVDRFGYARARWLPGESDDWLDLSLLSGQIEALRREPEILPPPDEHIH